MEYAVTASYDSSGLSQAMSIDRDWKTLVESVCPRVAVKLAALSTCRSSNRRLEVDSNRSDSLKTAIAAINRRYLMIKIVLVMILIFQSSRGSS